MTVQELINKLSAFDPKLPVYAYNEFGHMREIKVRPISVQLKKTLRYDPIQLVLINPDKI